MLLIFPATTAESEDLVENDIDLRELLGIESLLLDFIDVAILSSYDFP